MVYLQSSEAWHGECNNPSHLLSIITRYEICYTKSNSTLIFLHLDNTLSN